MLLALTSAIVYPDKLLAWLSDRTGRCFTRWHVFILASVSIGLMIIAIIFFLPVCYKLDRITPFLMVGLLAAMRFGGWLTARIFGFDDD
jgi:tryptophan-rich sensory protein